MGLQPAVSGFSYKPRARRINRYRDHFMRIISLAIGFSFILLSTYAQNAATPQVEPSNDARWQGRDAGAWINAAIASLPGTGGNVYVAAGTYTFSTTIVLNKNISLHGAGSNFTILRYTGSGDAVRMEAGTSPPYMNGAITGITLAGNSKPNAVGIHHIDTIGSIYDDLTVENFTGASGAGMWFDNQAQFSERLSLRKLSVYRNTIGWRFTNSNPLPAKSNSFSYWRVSEVHFQIAAKQTAILADGAGLIDGKIPSVFILNGDLGISANEEAPTSRLITLRNGAAFSGYHFDLFAECTGCATRGIGFTIDSTSTMACDGHITLDSISNEISGRYVFQPDSAKTAGGGAAYFQVSFRTTSSTSDRITMKGMTAGGHCSISPTSAAAAANAGTTYISEKSNNEIIVTHAPAAGLTYDILCTPN
jgi:hypothetical protein